jgi:hypothetical protein
MYTRNRWLRTALCLQLAISLLSPNPRAFADDTVKEFVYTGADPGTSFQLKSEQYQTIYQTQEQQTTCTRQVQNGYDTQCTPTTRRECQDVTTQQCQTVNHQECTPTTRRQCTSTTRRECQNTTRRECNTVNHQECQNTTRRQCTSTTRRECETVNHQQCTGGGEQCENVPDEICHTDQHGQRVCQSTTRRECHTVPQTCTNVPEQECRDVPDQVCQDVPDQVCTNVPEQQCQDVPDQVCQDVPDQVCQDVPDQVCQDIPTQQCGPVTTQQCQDVPDQVCQQVPHYDTETYACTQEVQVPVGQQLVLQNLGNVSVKYGAVPQGIKPNEDFVAQLADRDVGLGVKQASGALVIFADKKQDVKDADSTHRVITTELDLSFASAAEIAAPVKGGIADVALTNSSVSFSLGKVTRKDFLTIGLSLVADSTSAQILNVPQVPLDKITFQDNPQTGRTVATIQLADLGVQSALQPGKYALGISAGLLTQGIDKLLDASALAGIQPATYQQDIVVTFGSGDAGSQSILNMVAGGIKDVKLAANQLSFTTGKLVAKQYVSLAFKLSKQTADGPQLLAQGTLFDGDQPVPAFLKLTDQGDRTLVTAALDQVGIQAPLPQAIYVIDLDLGLKKDKLSGLIPDDVLAAAKDAVFDGPSTDLAIPADQILGMTGAGVQDVALSASSLTFTLGKAVAPNLLSIRLTLSKKGLVSSSQIFDDTLDLDAQNGNTAIAAAGARSKFTVDLSKLSLSDSVSKGKNYIVHVVATLQKDQASSLLSADQLNQAKTADSGDVKLKAN